MLPFEWFNLYCCLYMLWLRSSSHKCEGIIFFCVISILCRATILPSFFIHFYCQHWRWFSWWVVGSIKVVLKKNYSHLSKKKYRIYSITRLCYSLHSCHLFTDYMYRRKENVYNSSLMSFQASLQSFLFHAIKVIFFLSRTQSGFNDFKNSK